MSKQEVKQKSNIFNAYPCIQARNHISDKAYKQYNISN